MVITQTPFRMSFFGGGTDYEGFYKEHGGAVLSTTFNKYCYVTIRNLPHFFEYSSQLVYSIIERVKTLDEIKHPLMRNAMKYMNMNDIHMIYDADLPARSGLGTSSSFAVGMLNAMYAQQGKYVDKKKLAEDAIYLERILCAESGGIQDQIAAAFGGFNRINFSAEGFSVSPLIISRERKELLNENLMLFFTGFSRLSSEIASSQVKATKDKTAQLKEMLSLVDDAEKILVSGRDLNEFGKLLDYTWKLKRGITNKISTDSIDEMYKKAIDAGALGGKLLGAGGGGFFVFYVEKDKQQSVKTALKGFMHVPFEFEDGGTKINYYKAENTAVEAK